MTKIENIEKMRHVYSKAPYMRLKSGTEHLSCTPSEGWDMRVYNCNIETTTSETPPLRANL